MNLTDKRLEEAFQFLKGPDFITAESQPTQPTRDTADI